MAHLQMLLALPVFLGLAAALSPGGATSFRVPTPAVSPSRTSQIVLGRKGRPNTPGGGMMAQPQQQMREPEAPPDGTPLFYLYARNPKTRVMWYPVSMLRGDQQSKGLISAWLGSPIAKSVFKDRLDEGIARSIFESERRLTDMARQQYPAIKKIPKLEFGYKLVDRAVNEKVAKGELEEQKVLMVTKDMVQDSWADKAMKSAKGLLGQK